jgi:TATA-box binding protein (TBP) (component of TFIID and TFIIIB)
MKRQSLQNNTNEDKDNDDEVFTNDFTKNKRRRLGDIYNTKWINHEKYVEKVKQTMQLSLNSPSTISVKQLFPKITNYVVNFFIGAPFHLTDLSMYASNVDYKPENFAASTLRIGDTACLVFRIGKIVITGAKSYHEVMRAGHACRLFLETIPQLVRVKDDPSENENNNNRIQKSHGKFAITSLRKNMTSKAFKVVNVVGSGKVSDKPIHLALLDSVMTRYSSWDPEVFPGLKFTIKSEYCPMMVSECTSHLFDSGRAVIMGAQCLNDIVNCFSFLRCLASHFLDEEALYTTESKYKYRIRKMLDMNEDQQQQEKDQESFGQNEDTNGVGDDNDENNFLNKEEHILRKIRDLCKDIYLTEDKHVGSSLPTSTSAMEKDDRTKNSSENNTATDIRKDSSKYQEVDNGDDCEEEDEEEAEDEQEEEEESSEQDTEDDNLTEFYWGQL